MTWAKSLYTETLSFFSCKKRKVNLYLWNSVILGAYPICSKCPTSFKISEHIICKYLFISKHIYGCNNKYHVSIYNKSSPFICNHTDIAGFPGGATGKEPTCQCRRRKKYRFDPWAQKIPWGSIRAWEISGTEEPGELQSMGSQRVRYDWSDLAHMHTYIVYCTHRFTP